jgi:hypothetical protein
MKLSKVATADRASVRTVTEVYANCTVLKDKPVAIRVRVVKVTAGLMGEKWTHLRDCSGAAAGDSIGLLVTSEDEPEGEVTSSSLSFSHTRPECGASDSGPAGTDSALLPT